MLQNQRRSQKKGKMWPISRAVAWRLLSIRAGQLQLSPCMTSRKRLAFRCLRWSYSADKASQTMAEVATWAKLAETKDVEMYMQQNIKDGADYIKMSLSSTFQAFALSYLSSAWKREDSWSEFQSSLNRTSNCRRQSHPRSWVDSCRACIDARRHPNYSRIRARWLDSYILWYAADTRTYRCLQSPKHVLYPNFTCAWLCNRRGRAYYRIFCQRPSSSRQDCWRRESEHVWMHAFWCTDLQSWECLWERASIESGRDWQLAVNFLPYLGIVDMLTATFVKWHRFY